MIGFLTGTLHSKQSSGQIIILVSGVGYLVTVPVHYINMLKEPQPIDLYIYTHVREEAFDLYGFFTPDEEIMFKLILSVSGIGPKTALAVIDRGSSAIQSAIQDANTEFFTTIPRLGLKNAQKIIIELKNKLGGIKDLDLSDENKEFTQAIEGLQVMGYTKKEALDAIQNVPVDKKTVEEKINYALRSLGKMELK